MSHEGTVFYEKGYSINVNTPSDELFYYFDYDERSADINMNFQHFHDFYEIHILLDTKAAHIIEGDFFELQQYDIVFLKPSVLHKTYYPDGPPRKRLIINFAIPTNTIGLQSGLDKLLLSFDKSVQIFRFNEEQRKYIFTFINDVFTLGKDPSSVNNVKIHVSFLQFLCAIYDNRRHNTYIQNNQYDSITNKIYSITSYIHNNYQTDLTLEYISRKFFISSYYLSHKFKDVTGFTFTNYIQMTRIRNSQQLLLYTDMKITDISEKCGFTSFSQFNRTFNRYAGLSPSKFRSSKTSNMHLSEHYE